MSFSRFRVKIEQGRNDVGNDLYHDAALILNHPSLTYLTCPNRQRPAALPTPTTTPTPEDEERTSDCEATCLHLRTLTTEMLNIICNPTTSTYTNAILFSALSPDFVATKDSSIDDSARSAQRGMQVFASNLEVSHLMPNLSGEVLSSVAKLHEGGKTAEVWSWLRMTGMPVSEVAVKVRGERVEGEGLVKECVCVHRWERRGEFDREDEGRGCVGCVAGWMG